MSHSVDPTIERGQRSATDLIRGVTLAPERLVGMPVDVVNQAMGGLGLPMSQRPVMGSDWLIENNPLRSPENMPTGSGAEIAGDLLGSVVADPFIIPAKVAGLIGTGLAGLGSIRRVKPTKSTELESLRGKPVDEAIEIARGEPHLIKSGDKAEGLYVGGPRDLKTKRALTNLRKQFDEFVAQDTRGSMWYDKTRSDINTASGGDRNVNDWISANQAQYSAGASPEHEIAFSIKDMAATLAGMDATPRFPAQRAGSRLAVAMNDPRAHQLGTKTGKYAKLINPNQELPPGATGVNDFRHARNFKYTEADGSPQGGALTEAQHRFLDYETALAVDRANKNRLGDRSNWTGEQLQAAPWVRQKAMAILEQRPAILQRYIKAGVPEKRAAEMAYEDAFSEAVKTVGDFYPKHVAYATHEAQPGSVAARTGHMSRSVDASNAQRAEFADDPRSSWRLPDGRDAIYSGLRHRGPAGTTGVAMRVLPSQEMQGIFPTPGGGPLQTNRGDVARPLVAFDTAKDGLKTIPPADKALIEAGESVRAYGDVQDASAAHKHWTGGPPGKSPSLFTPLDGPLTRDEILGVREGVRRQAVLDPVHGLPEVVDTGQGVTVSSFYPEVGPISKTPKKAMGLLGEAVVDALPNRTGLSPRRTNVDSVYRDYTDAWAAGEGSEAATKRMLKDVNATPEIRQAFDDNPHLAQKALDRISRNRDWESRWGASRKDVNRALEEIAKGPGWIGRLEALIGKGVLPVALLGAILSNVDVKSEGSS
jgi:hypothetical protein